jgi:predicted nuclease with TOPRIM domain
MTKALDMKDVGWLKLYVNSEVDKFSKKFDVEFDQQEIEDVCKNVADMKLPEGIDVFYVMMSLVFDKVKLYPLQLDIILVACELKGLTLGLDMLIYIYGKFVEVNGYDEQVAFIFKNCIQYTIPF